MEIGNEAEDGTTGATRGSARGVDEQKLLLHRVDAANGPDGVDGERNHHTHLDDELKDIGDQDAPQSG